MWQDFRNKRELSVLCLIPQKEYAKQKILVNHLPHITVIDWRNEFLASTRPEQRHLNLNPNAEINRLKQWSELRPGKVLCIINTEYFLTRLASEERQIFWQRLQRDFVYSKSILVYCALDVPQLLPDNLEQWEISNRIIRLP